FFSIFVKNFFGMAESKLDLPEDLMASKPSDQSWNPNGNHEEKGLIGFIEEMKDQVASESIPLSPQWLYAKPNEPKAEARGLSSLSLGSSAEPNQKELWRSDVADDKKDWRKLASEVDGGRRWREEERETGLLGRRDRRKMDSRSDNNPTRETNEKALSASDRWHDGSNRSLVHETRRDTKWSIRWGPDDKEKGSRLEKRTDLEKENSQGEMQSSVPNNRSVPERDIDSRDKWRPRHRLEGNTGAPGSHRAAPGFGAEKGRAEGLNLGFSVGRGKTNVSLLRTPAVGPVGSVHYDTTGNVPGKPTLSVKNLVYPRGKLLDIYRKQKLDLLLAHMPDNMDEVTPITQIDAVEPLAFVIPDAEQAVVLNDISKGKLTSSGASDGSFKKGRSTYDISFLGKLN
ncbi:hypothetical protein M569_01148, partial [Genlisea aurea]